MNGLYKEKGRRYFAASNTKDGFVSYFDEIFSDADCDRVYIIKGGPGCGKSTFMKKVGAAAEEKGLNCEYFYCSSDPKSLDGIIVREKRVAVIDGTSPHTAEPTLAGAREIIVDLGKGWDTDGLYECRNELKSLAEKKKRHYGECYRLLNAKHVMDGLVYNLVFPNICFDKMDKSALRLSKSVFKNHRKKSSGANKTRITEALSGLGKVKLYTFENEADVCVFLKEPFAECRLSHLFMTSVYETAKSLGVQTFVSYKADKKGEINALYFPDMRVSLSEYDEKAVSDCDRSLKKCKIINCSRFVDMKALSHTKPLRKFYCRLSENLERQALDELSEAGKTHAEAEKIYRRYTDYTTVEKITNEYIEKILNS